MRELSPTELDIVGGGNFGYAIWVVFYKLDIAPPAAPSCSCPCCGGGE